MSATENIFRARSSDIPSITSKGFDFYLICPITAPYFWCGDRFLVLEKYHNSCYNELISRLGEDTLFEKCRTSGCDLFGLTEQLQKKEKARFETVHPTLLENATAEISVRFQGVR